MNLYELLAAFGGGLIGRFKKGELLDWVMNLREIIYHGIIGLSLGIMWYCRQLRRQ